jgi:hypothetical protein
MQAIISCPVCNSPLTVNSPDTIRTKCSITKIENAFPQINTCTNPECGSPFFLYWVP